MTIGAPTGGNTVSGTVSFSETATGPLYVGFYNQSTGAVYVDVVGSKTSPPHSPAAYTVQVPTGSDYFFVGILDQNNSGLLTGPGQVTNTNGNNQAPVSITGNMTNEDLTLPSGNSTATVQTQAWEQINSNGTNTYYNIGFNVNGNRCAPAYRYLFPFALRLVRTNGDFLGPQNERTLAGTLRTSLEGTGLQQTDGAHRGDRSHIKREARSHQPRQECCC
jgi:hypothetical protein